MVTELLQKYLWLIQTFVQSGTHGLSLEELSDKWEDRFYNPYSRRTFNNHRAAIEEVFGIRIACNRSFNRYYIEYSEDVTDDNAATAWLINTFTVNNILALGKERLSGRVSVEDIPSGHTYLTSIMEAMTSNNEIIISYHKYTSSSQETFTVRPYAVKEVAKRWYLVAYCHERKALRVYGLDRIISLEMTDKRFKMPEGFDIDEIFDTSFGIYLPEGKSRKIIFCATEMEARFLRDLPIHKSQKEVDGKSPDGKVTFEIRVCPDKDLIMEFCRHGSRLEVISPDDVRKAVRDELTMAASLYNDKSKH